MKEGNTLTRIQVWHAANSIIADMMENDIDDTPFVGDLMRQIYISLEHPLPTPDEEWLDWLNLRAFNLVIDDLKKQIPWK